MKRALLLLLSVLPPAAFATTFGAPIAHTGIPVENNGLTCQRCHNSFPLNPPGGQVRIEAFHYQPGQKQTVRVTVFHPDAVKWGFQLTARQASDLTKKAGNFTPAGVRVRCSDTVIGRDITVAEPCGSDFVEYAGHNENIVFGGANGSKTFEVEWTAPSADVGDVVFYAAGNAASNSGGNQGDRVFTDSLSIEAEGRGCPNTVPPTLQAVGNAASFGREVSMNTLITIRGSNFATSGTNKSAGRADFKSGYPRELGCVAVEIGGQRAPLLFVRPDQINAQVPTVTTTGAVQVRVITNPGRPNQLMSDVGTMTLLAYSPALFTFNGRSVAAVHNADGVIAADPTVVTGARVVRAGDVLQLYATGLGPTDPVWQAGETPQRTASLRDRLTITVGGTTVAAADVLYAGIVPGSISGLYQINIRVPATVSEGEVPIRLNISGVMSPEGTTLPVRR